MTDIKTKNPSYANKTIQAYAFENNNEPGLYLCDGIDCLSDENENGDVKDLSQALCVLDKNLEAVTDEHLKDFKGFMRAMKTKYITALDWDGDIEPNYTAKLVELTPDQVEIIRDRNEW